MTNKNYDKEEVDKKKHKRSKSSHDGSKAHKKSSKESKRHKSHKKDEKDKKHKRHKTASHLNDDSAHIPSQSEHRKLQTITENEYFAKNQEFRVWLHMRGKKNFEDLTSEEAKEIFNNDFVIQYNDGLLDAMYYSGNIPLDLRKTANHTQHKWSFKLNSGEMMKLQDLAEDIDNVTNGQRNTL